MADAPAAGAQSPREGVSPSNGDRTPSSMALVTDSAPTTRKSTAHGIRSSRESPLGARDSATAMVQVRGHDYAISGRYASQRLRLCEVVTAPYFDGAIAFVVVLNSAMIGADLSFQVDGLPSSSWQRRMVLYTDHCFLIVYTAELALRLFALGTSCLRDRWVQFDMVLVVSGILTNWIIEPIYAGAEMSNMTALRVARLMRVARAVRLLAQLKDLLTLVRGLVDTASIICNALLLLFILLYIFGCAGVEFITKHELNIGDNPDPVFTEIVEQHFSSLPMTMLTLAQFVCLDSVAAIYRPLVRLDGFLVIYFLICVVFLGIVLMNLITAVTVNGAIAMAAKDKATLCFENEESGNRFEKDLMSMFYRLDKDQSHTVSRNELVDLSDEDKTVMFGPTVVGNLWDIFDALDADGNGELSMDEFCNGIREVAYSHAPVEFKRINKHIQLLHELVLVLRDTVVASLSANGNVAIRERAPAIGSPAVSVEYAPQQDDQSKELSFKFPLKESPYPHGPPLSCTSALSDELRAAVAAAVEETLWRVLPGPSSDAVTHLAKFPPPATSMAPLPNGIARSEHPPVARPGPRGRAQPGDGEPADPPTPFSSGELRATPGRMGGPPPSPPRSRPSLPTRCGLQL